VDVTPQPPRQPPEDPGAAKPKDDDELKRKDTVEKVKPDKEQPEKIKAEKEKVEVKEIEKVKADKEHPEKIKADKEQPEKIKPDKEQIEKIKPDKEVKLEAKEIEKIKPEKEHKLEVKEIEKIKADKEHPEKVVPEKHDKELVEGGRPGDVVNPADLMAHVESLEETARQLRHFIQRSSRPDLSQGALRNEADLQEDDDA
jgi:hypothetical protein